MLPFLKRPPVAGVIVKVRKPDEEAPPTAETPELDAASEAILKAITAQDPKALSRALTDAHDIMHSYMDQEPNDFDNLNEKAASEEME